MLHVVKNGYEIKPMTGFWSKVKEVGCWLGDMVMDGSAKKLKEHMQMWSSLILPITHATIRLVINYNFSYLMFQIL